MSDPTPASVADSPAKLTPYLCVEQAAQAIEFYSSVFGATEVIRFTDPAGKVGHSELKIGPARLYLADEYPDLGVVSPKRLGGTAISMVIEVPDVDDTYRRAIDAGATTVREPADQFDGRRATTLLDPFGHRWLISSPEIPASKVEVRRLVGDHFVIS